MKEFSSSRSKYYFVSPTATCSSRNNEEFYFISISPPSSLKTLSMCSPQPQEPKQYRLIPEVKPEIWDKKNKSEKQFFPILQKTCLRQKFPLRGPCIHRIHSPDFGQEEGAAWLTGSHPHHGSLRNITLLPCLGGVGLGWSSVL